ncbi:MAG TPA: DNA polymerase III subunit alpha [Burkholderiales bacterium]|nr:DNA polymerase III subunit alpha [Burkholderiales bacterium]
MSELPFVHLRLHSEYSVTDGIVRLDDAVAAAAADDMPALALTDLGNVFGLVKFYQAARQRGVKPIVGCDVWIENASARDQPHRLLLLCQTRAGYRNLCELLTRAYRENQYRGRAELRREWFDASSAQGLIALSGAHLGDVGAALLAGNAVHAAELARAWSQVFPQRYYLELQRLPQASDGAQLESCVRHTLSLASELGLPVVATHPVQFVKPGDFNAHEARVCIAEGYTLADTRRPRRFAPEQYFKSQSGMRELFADIPSALANAVEIAKRCNLTLELGKPQLPEFPVPEGMDREMYLRHCAQEGLGRRLQVLYPQGDEAEKQWKDRYSPRLEFEIRVINQMGFAGYFLIVADFINWAKSNGVPVGPGRGSGAGSLVAYALGITELDPLHYGLLFERFLNPERVSMPDFDIDFCQDGRDRVIDYVKRKYGAESVSQIATFGTMAAKGVVRDVGRVLDLGYGFCDQIAKLIPFQPGQHITLARAREMEPLLKEREQNEEEVRELLALGEQLEGLVRNVGMHAGGVLIAPGKLTDFCPLYIAGDAAGAVSQFDMKDVEAVGLVKFDFLGLTTLTILDWTLRFMRRLDPASTLKLDDIPLDDAATYRMFANGDTTAIFQFESRGMRELLKQARPDRLEDLIALNALYRPGPMDLIPEYIDRKHGRKRVTYPDPRVEAVLAETYGIMVYQEQVMQMAQIVGGYSLGAADLLRRAMGKKKPEEMAQQRGVFRAGAANNGLKQARADELFDLMEKFAGYGFNKSHAAAYALVAYQTAYFKTHHPAAFMAANLSAVMGDTDKVRQFYDDVRGGGITVLPPDINRGEYRFVPLDAGTISYGLGAIKGTGEAAIVSIVQARDSDGPFTDLFDFCRRVDRRLVNRRVVEALVRAGAFDAIDSRRASLFASVGVALDSAEQASRHAQQASLFGEAAAGASLQPIDARPWTDAERLQNEKLALGFYLSGHPFSAYRDEIRQFVRTTLDQLKPSGDYGGAQGVLIAGIVEDVRKLQSARLVVLNLSDGTATQEITVYNEIFEQHRELIAEDRLLVIEARLRTVRRGDDPDAVFLRISAEKIYDLAAARGRFARCMRLEMNGQADAVRLKELLAPYCNGSCPVSVVYYNQQARCEVELGEAWRVNLRDDLLQSLAAWLSAENVSIIYRDRPPA